MDGIIRGWHDHANYKLAVILCANYMQYEYHWHSLSLLGPPKKENLWEKLEQICYRQIPFMLPHMWCQSPEWMCRPVFIYTVGHKKTCPFYFFDNSGKYWRIFV